MYVLMYLLMYLTLSTGLLVRTSDLAADTISATTNPLRLWQDRPQYLTSTISQ